MSAKFDIEKRALELLPKVSVDEAFVAPMDHVRRLAVDLAREAYAAGRREGCEEVAVECEKRDRLYADSTYWYDDAHTAPSGGVFGFRQGVQWAADIARRLAAPPAHETREQRLEKALREISYFGDELRGAKACADIARRALEEK